MSQLIVTKRQPFMGFEIPVILGGFGEDKRSMSDKTIAEIHGQPVYEIRRRIGDNIKRFQEGIDFIDLKQRMGDSQTLGELYMGSELSHKIYQLESIEHFLLENIGYAKQSITQAEHIYLLSERGYSKLIKIMDTDLAWEVHDKIMDEYFQMREEKKEIKNLSPQLQLLINMELEQQRQAQELIEVKEQAQRASDWVESIRDVVSLDSNSWRDDTRNLINKMAQEIGGGQAFREIRKESYELLEKRMGVNLKTRLTNRVRVMAENGECKSKRDKVSYIDVIAADKKLIEGYMAIVKEMAIKYGF